MKSKHRHKGQDRKHRHQGGPHGQQQPQSGGFKKRDRDRRWSGSRPQQHGAKTCPMCGAVVPDLRRHINEKHDDPASHPRD